MIWFLFIKCHAKAELELDVSAMIYIYMCVSVSVGIELKIWIMFKLETVIPVLIRITTNYSVVIDRILRNWFLNGCGYVYLVIFSASFVIGEGL